MKKLTLIAAVLTGMLILTWSSKSQAIGDTEAGILWGIFGTAVLSEVFSKDEESQYYPHNPNGDYPPFRCSSDSVTCAYERGKWERGHEEWLKAKDRAYQCGRYPEKCNAP